MMSFNQSEMIISELCAYSTQNKPHCFTTIQIAKDYFLRFQISTKKTKIELVSP